MTTRDAFSVQYIAGSKREFVRFSEKGLQCLATWSTGCDLLYILAKYLPTAGFEASVHQYSFSQRI
jgi:hypothetical protein